jgi:hypothetical protein
MPSSAGTQHCKQQEGCGWVGVGDSSSHMQALWTRIHSNKTPSNAASSQPSHNTALAATARGAMSCQPMGAGSGTGDIKGLRQALISPQGRPCTCESSFDTTYLFCQPSQSRTNASATTTTTISPLHARTPYHSLLPPTHSWLMSPHMLGEAPHPPPPHHHRKAAHHHPPGPALVPYNYHALFGDWK